MSQETRTTFNHFSLIGFTPAYWCLDREARQRVLCTWLEEVRSGVEALHTYQTFGAEAESDLLVWCAMAGPDPDVPQRFFGSLGCASAPVRSYLNVHRTLWGFTRPSQYTKVRSAQELDPFAAQRLPYLIMYPFVKTAEWYLKDRAERKEMMAQHIKVGKQYKDITQLLLYSFGLQDQEFVVVYETADLGRFLQLVEELRATEARVYTERDTPLHLGIFQPDMEALGTWL